MTNLMKFYDSYGKGRFALAAKIANESDCSVQTIVNILKGYNKTNDEIKLNTISKYTGIEKCDLFKKVL